MLASFPRIARFYATPAGLQASARGCTVSFIAQTPRASLHDRRMHRAFGNELQLARLLHQATIAQNR
jgi:hypothetical protein